MKSVKIIQKAGSRGDGNEKMILLFFFKWYRCNREV